MDINIVVPPFSATRFSGGIWCLLQHAQALARRGHRVRVIPTHPSPAPDWFPRPWAFELVRTAPGAALAHAAAALLRGAGAAVAWKLRPQDRVQQEAQVRASLGSLGGAIARFASYGVRQGGALEHLACVMPAADVTLATDAETAWPVRLLGRGQLAYFAQHYEPYFWKERLGGEASLREAEVSYRLGLHQIVNSPWLQATLRQHQPGLQVHLCANAIDLAVFDGEPTARQPGGPLRVISYGGRDAEWKGFRELCEAMRLVKARRPGLAVQWNVYGQALLPPDNPICTFRPLGFLNPVELAAAYRNHHVMLSASWYESFPLFPLEAMACGIAPITTQPGTEQYARDGETALVVPPREPEAIATALLRLADDEPLRQRLAAQGRAVSQAFTWARAGATMEAVLAGLVAEPTPPAA